MEAADRLEELAAGPEGAVGLGGEAIEQGVGAIVRAEQALELVEEDSAAAELQAAPVASLPLLEAEEEGAEGLL